MRPRVRWGENDSQNQVSAIPTYPTAKTPFFFSFLRWDSDKLALAPVCSETRTGCAHFRSRNDAPFFLCRPPNTRRTCRGTSERAIVPSGRPARPLQRWYVRDLLPFVPVKRATGGSETSVWRRLRVYVCFRNELQEKEKHINERSGGKKQTPTPSLKTGSPVIITKVGFLGRK